MDEIEKIIDDADEWFNVVEGDIDARDYARRLVSEGIKVGQEIEETKIGQNDWRKLCEHNPKCFYGTEHIIKVIIQSRKETFEKVKQIMERHIKNPGIWRMNQQEALELALEEMEDNLGKELK